MSEISKNKIEYLVVFINKFARHFSLTDTQAFRYIKRFGGINFVLQNYGIMHTLDMDDTNSDMSVFCRKSGGKL